MRKIAIIPARSGSKGLPDKNIKKLNCIPLMAYSIRAAVDSGIFDCVHVSTDSIHYADIACKHGADVPFLRSEATSSDRADSWSVVKEVLQRYENAGQSFDLVTLLQPTSPLRDARDILGAYQLFNEKNAQAVVSVCEMEHSPLWSSVLPEDLSMDGFIQMNGNTQRQRLQNYYRLNGAIYMVKKSFLMENSNIYRKGCYAFIMEKNHSVDIDNLTDFKMAEFLIGGGYRLKAQQTSRHRNHAYLWSIYDVERRCA